MVNESIEIKVNQYRLNASENTPERYLVEWPEGCIVTDMRSGLKYRVKNGIRSVILDEDIFAEAMRLDEPQISPEAVVIGSGEEDAVSHPTNGNGQNAPNVRRSNTHASATLGIGSAILFVSALSAALYLQRLRHSRKNAC